jgi:predicted amidophosphoribosyltransferase
MASVADLTQAVDHLVSPRSGRGVCRQCFNFTRGYDRCYACSIGEQHFDAIVPISYSVAREELHAMLAGYKRGCGFGAERQLRRLAATLWRFLVLHEACLAARAGVRGFDVVTTVPSSDPGRDAAHPLRRLVGELCGSTRARHHRLLELSGAAVVPRRFSANRYVCRAALDGANVLLIDDTWTTGASAQSAAAALRSAGAAAVAGVAIGRHVNREWYDNDQRLRTASGRFDWSLCGLCAPSDTAHTEMPEQVRAA